ncbi:MAG: type II toxin-antitoxin system VapC family toxin [Verrucomicrobiota bacterium]
MTYCLDTNVMIALMRNRKPVVDRLRTLSPVQVKVPEVVRAELAFGCLKSAHPNQETSKVDQVLAPFERLPFSGDAVEHYAAIRLDLEKRGLMIGPNDLLIAATARAGCMVMVTTNDREFSRVPGLVVENWE